MERRWYSVTEAADLLGVSHDTVSRLIDRGELPAIRVSKRIVRIPIPAFDVYASGRTPTKRRIVRRRVAELPPIAPGERVGDLEPVQLHLRLTDGGLEDYLANVVSLVERYGLGVDAGTTGPSITETPDTRRLALRAQPPGGTAARAGVEIRETWIADGTGGFERSEYVYELMDHERGFRRAFHLHDVEWFQRRLLVVVHEHCERPIGQIDCQHYAGSPIKDGYAGVVALVDAWTSDPPDCAHLRCLE